MVTDKSKQILALSSEVGIGEVGLSIARFAFAAQNISVIALPTVLFASRPDMGRIVRHEIPSKVIDDQLSALRQDQLLDGLKGVLTGYFSSPHQVKIVAEHLERLRQMAPSLQIVVDPILGDFDTGLYVSSDVAGAVRDYLLPLADVITPNLYEFLWLVGDDTRVPLKQDALLARLKLKHQKLPTKTVVVTSAEIKIADETSDFATISTVLIGEETLVAFRSRYHENVPKGTGDVFAATLLARMVLGRGLPQAVDHTVRLLERIADKAQGLARIEPYLLFNSEHEI